jgi:hypothetical protein
MKLKIVVCLGMLAAASPAIADEGTSPVPSMPASAAPPPPSPPTVIISDQDKQVWVQLAGAFDQCLGAVTAGGNQTICKFVENYLTGFAARVATAK